MSSAKGLYFIAIAVMALGLSHDYRAGRLPWAHRYLDKPLAVAQEYSTCLKAYVRSEFLPYSIPAQVERARLERDRVEMSHDQVRLMVDQARMVRREVERHRGEIEQARQMAADQVHGMRVVCPQDGRFVVDIPAIDVHVPNVRVVVPQVTNAIDIDDEQ